MRLMLALGMSKSGIGNQKKKKKNWEDKPLEFCSSGANDFQSEWLLHLN